MANNTAMMKNSEGEGFDAVGSFEKLDLGRSCFPQPLIAWVHPSREALRGGDSTQQFCQSAALLRAERREEGVLMLSRYFADSLQDFTAILCQI